MSIRNRNPREEACPWSPKKPAVAPAPELVHQQLVNSRADLMAHGSSLASSSAVGCRVTSPFLAAGTQHSAGAADVTLNLDGHVVPVHALVVELSGADLIMGMDVLAGASIDLFRGILAMPGDVSCIRFVHPAVFLRPPTGSMEAMRTTLS